MVWNQESCHKYVNYDRLCECSPGRTVWGDIDWGFSQPERKSPLELSNDHLTLMVTSAQDVQMSVPLRTTHTDDHNLRTYEILFSQLQEQSLKTESAEGRLKDRSPRAREQVSPLKIIFTWSCEKHKQFSMTEFLRYFVNDRCKRQFHVKFTLVTADTVFEHVILQWQVPLLKNWRDLLRAKLAKFCRPRKK